MTIYIDSDLDCNDNPQFPKLISIKYHYHYRRKCVKVVIPVETNPKKLRLQTRIRTNVLAQRTVQRFFKIDHYIPYIQRTIYMYDLEKIKDCHSPTRTKHMA